MRTEEPKSLKEARYVMFVAAGELFSARNNDTIRDIGPYEMARDIARENFLEEYEKHYGFRPTKEHFEQLELSI
jgi:hypothetical protein